MEGAPNFLRIFTSISTWNSPANPVPPQTSGPKLDPAAFGDLDGMETLVVHKDDEEN